MSSAPLSNPSAAPRRWVLPVHIAAIVMMQSTIESVRFMLPVVARKEFGVTDWQTVIVTAAPQVLAILSIFWNDLLSRVSIRRYLVVFWVFASLPVGLMGLVDSYWPLLALHLVSSIGTAGMSAVSGELFKRLYPDRRRGAVFGWVTGAMLLGGAATTFSIGCWLDSWSHAFRAYMPMASALQLAGVLLLGWLARVTGAERAPVPRVGERPLLARVVEPITHMREVLARDRVFYRYEAAFMTYGIGWMTCAALIPILVTDKLHLRYDQAAESTHMTFQLAMMLMTVPAGKLMDRLGATRMSGLSFAFYTLYPLALIFAVSGAQLKSASVLYGIAAAGVNVCWLLGPVNLAPTPQQVPQYVAIHTTLVGLRGALFQALGVWIYRLTGSFTWPLILAALAFAWAAWQMRALHRITIKPAREITDPVLPPS